MRLEFKSERTTPVKEVGLAALVWYCYWENTITFVVTGSWLNWDLNMVLSVGKPKLMRAKSRQVICPIETLVVGFRSALNTLLPIHKGIESRFCF